MDCIEFDNRMFCLVYLYLLFLSLHILHSLYVSDFLTHCVNINALLDVKNEKKIYAKISLDWYELILLLDPMDIG